MPILLLNVAGMILLGAFLLLTENSVDMVLLIAAVWSLTLAGVLLFSYYRKKKEAGEAEKAVGGVKGAVSSGRVAARAGGCGGGSLFFSPAAGV